MGLVSANFEIVVTKQTILEFTFEQEVAGRLFLGAFARCRPEIAQVDAS